MGNICEVDNDCLQPPIREHIRQRSASEKNENLSMKKMIQFKKMKITQEYEIDGLLGEGSYGSVFRVKHRQTKVLRAAKRIEKQKRTI
jgi:serine/threonine protein kinase